MNTETVSLTVRDRMLVMTTAFLGWMFAGLQLAVSSLVMRDAAKSLLDTTDERIIGEYFGRLIVAFLLGAAVGGYLLGAMGDRIGRAKAMGISILWYSLFAGLTYFVREPWQLLILRFLTCMGVGGMWPNGIALLSEAWPGASRPLVSGVIGTAANVGIMLFSLAACFYYITPDHWRWTMVVGAAPAILGLIVLGVVPESPSWLALRRGDARREVQRPSVIEVFRPPWLRRTIVGIALGTIPLFGGWGSSNWANAWASQVEKKVDDPGLKGRLLLARSAPGSVTSLLGGAVAAMIGRRLSYFLFSLAAVGSAQYLFWFCNPLQNQFVIWTVVLGIFNGFFFGWLPYCLPELFPTRIRAAGAGVSFNFGRIATAFGTLIAAVLLNHVFDGQYAMVGRATSLIYAFGMLIVFVMPEPERDLSA